MRRSGNSFITAISYPNRCFRPAFKRSTIPCGAPRLHIPTPRLLLFSLQSVVAQQTLVALRELGRIARVVDRRRQPISPMPLRHFAQFPNRVLQSLAQTFEALGIAHCPRFPVRVRQHEVINQVRETLPLDSDAQLFHVREVGRSQASRRVLLREEYFLGRPLGCPPTLYPALQRAQLPVLEPARPTPLQVLEHRFG